MKNKKNKIIILVVMVLSVLVCSSVYASELIDSGDTAVTEISTVIEPQYIITIPNTLNIAARTETRQKMDVVFASGVLENSATVNIKINSSKNGFKLKNGIGEIPYKIYNSQSGNTELKEGSTVATFNQSTPEGTTVSIYAHVPNWNTLAAGKHTDNLTFALSYNS